MLRADALKQVERQLQDVTIRLQWVDDQGREQFGTAFFVTAEGTALTAFHNLRNLKIDPSDTLVGRWRMQDFQFRLKFPAASDIEWQEKYDIGVLETDSPPEGIRTLSAGFLEPGLDPSARGRYWRGKRVIVAGYPRGHRFELASGVGYMDASDPIQAKEIEGRRFDDLLAYTSTIVEDGAQHGPGLSGSPVYSTSDAAIVGINVAAYNKLYATELWPIREHLKPSASFRFVETGRRPVLPFPALKMPSAVAAVCTIAVLILLGWLLFRRAQHTIPVQLTASVTRLERGTAEPVNDGTTFHAGDRVQFHLTSPKDGHLYVVDQEIVGGVEQNAQIIFPTLRTGDGRNYVRAGEMVDFPGAQDKPPYLEAAPTDDDRYEGEELTLLVFAHPLPIALKEQPVTLDSDWFSLDGSRPRSFFHPLAPPADAVAIRRIRLRIEKQRALAQFPNR